MQLSGFEQTLALMRLEHRPTAILFHTGTASGILQALHKINLTVGKDVSLIGYDDLEIAKTNNPQLTVMRPPGKNAGEKIVEMLMEVIDGRSPELLHQIWQAEMVPRQSTSQL